MATKTTRIKNYTSILTVDQSIAIIRRALTEHKARRVSVDYDGDGEAAALEFQMELGGKTLAFRLPVNVKEVEVKVLRAYDATYLTDKLAAQAHRTAWANVKDWVLAQMALIDGNGVKLAQVFLPYAVNFAGKTYFEAFEERLALPSPSDDSITGSYVVVEER